VIHGEQDQLMPLEVGKELADQIPGAKFVSIGGAGHLSPLENPDAVNQAIRQFL
jgi:pimeloyl-ACP methyl ester carboxylesterase